ncbi:dockerin type I domain-containing protein [Neorhodopirellula pilleata]|uniref:Dockerin type I repeat protein n=1 Tax=Neorhodopirellula pilleata TaxID=2714738 RepID=A0A5C6A686_9BACT|nr:dockerin type I domain-containing protein [Neorhodopirellula pilleata]TWT94900.1 Dockerin type I repeat protein [Neorhodopirellula pilleata]
MSQRRPIRLESLEKRELLAAEVLSERTPNHLMNVERPSAVVSIPSDGDATNTDALDRLNRPMAPNVVPPGLLIADYFVPPENHVIAEHGNRVIVASNTPMFYPQLASESRPSELLPVSRLFVFEKTVDQDGETDGLTEILEIDLDFQVASLLVDGNTIVARSHQDNYGWYRLPSPMTSSDLALIQIQEGDDGTITHSLATKTLDRAIAQWDLTDGQLSLALAEHYQWWVDPVLPVDPIPYELIDDAQRVNLQRPHENTDLQPLLTLVDVSAGEFDRIASQTLPRRSEVTFVDGKTFVSTTTNAGAQLFGVSLVDGVMVKSDAVRYSGESFVHFADDGQSAIAIERDANDFTIARIHVFDLSGESPSLFSSIDVDENASYLIELTSQYAVFGHHEFNTESNTGSFSLVIVDTGRFVNVLPQNRVRRVELPENVQIGSGVNVGGDLMVFRASRTIETEVLETEVLETERPEGRIQNVVTAWETVLLTISLSRAEVISENVLDTEENSTSFGELVLIDADTRALGIRSWRHSPVAVRPIELDGVLTADLTIGMPYWPEFAESGFLFGKLDDSGTFVRDGFIDELPSGSSLFTPEHLLVTSSNRVYRYDWDSPNDPVSLPLYEVTEQVIAVDDYYQVIDDGRDHILDVLANDTMVYPWVTHFNGLTIDELLDAPEGVEIVGDRRIRIPAAIVESNETLTLRYVTGSEDSPSIGTVHIHVRQVDEETIDAIGESVRSAAAAELETNVQNVVIVNVERRFERTQRLPNPIPNPLPNEPVTGELTRADAELVFLLRSPVGTAQYATNLDGDVVWYRILRDETPIDREPKMKITVRAVDQDGQPIERAQPGQKFFLEVIGTDLRERSASGIFSAAFDLSLPEGQLRLTGQRTVGDDFSELGEAEITDYVIDEYAVMSLFSAGSDPVDGGTVPGVRQTLAKFEVEALRVGRIELEPNQVERTELDYTLFGMNSELMGTQVIFEGTRLLIQPTERPDEPSERIRRLDANGSGDVTAVDALMVINFLNNNGPMSRDDLDLAAMPSVMTLDTNNDGAITALDALVVINQINASTSAAGEPSTRDLDSSDDDERMDDQLGGLF